MSKLVILSKIRQNILCLLARRPRGNNLFLSDAEHPEAEGTWDVELVSERNAQFPSRSLALNSDNDCACE
jgi:hypothetical protein